MPKLIQLLCCLPLLLGLPSCEDSDKSSEPPKAEPGSAMKPSTTVADFSRSAVSNADPSQPAGPASPLPSDDATADEELNALLKKISPAMSAEEALALIDSARAFPSAKLCELVLALLKHPSVEVRSQALTLIEGHEAPRIVEVVRASLADRDPAVRLQGVEVLKHLRGSEAESVFLSAMADYDPNVRMLALTSALEVSPEFREQALTKAVISRHEDVAGSALTFLEAELTKTHLPQFVAALDHPAASVRAIAFERLYLTLDKKFANAAEARVWWEQNRHRFDDDLVMIELPPESAPPR